MAAADLARAARGAGTRHGIVVHLAVPGYHSWPQAPPEVAFLRTRHRHLFHFRLLLPVAHGDRALEFFTVQAAILRALDAQFGVAPCDFGARSCEMLADLLLDWFPDASEARVSEDDENEGRAAR